MKKNLFHSIIISAALITSISVQAQNVGIGTNNPAYSAALDISSTNKGLLIPRLTVLQKMAIDTPVIGLMIYQTDAAPGFYFYNGTGWTNISNGSAFFIVSPLNNNIVYRDMVGSYNKNFLLNADSINYDISGPIGSLQPKLFFVPGKQGAFRTGAVTNSNWNNDSIGNASFAAGYNSKALATYSTAVGYNSVASGYAATAFGYESKALNIAATSFGNNSTASGMYAVAIGNNNSATGTSATAFGEYNIASGNYALVSGSENQAIGTNAVALGNETIASGFNAFAVGYGVSASGDASVAAGSGSQASGNFTVAIGSGVQATALGATALGFQTKATNIMTTTLGYQTEASGQKATAMGEFSIASNLVATAMGSYTNASGPYSTAMGYQTIASGDYSTAMGGGTISSSNFTLTTGYSTRASGFAATAIGSLSNATGYYTLAAGVATQAHGEVATATGGSTIATGNNSFTAGEFTRAKSFAEMAIGRYNDTLIAADGVVFKADSNRLFTIGIGTSANARKTALVVQQDGMVGIGVRRPTALLHVNGDIKVNDDNVIELGANIAGKQVDAGKIGYAAFTPFTLDIVGGGNIQAQRKIKFWAEGGATFTGIVNAMAFNVTSDGRFKTNIQPLRRPLELVQQLRGVSYYFNRQQFAEKAFPEQLQFGFIAQEVEQVLPQIVQTGSDGYKAVNYAAVIPLLTESIKAQQEQINQLLLKMEALQKQLRELSKTESHF
ncbi:MAG: tail fiber domain-containing protein [Bacteroidetes bacterium]|nr:tail fiber domain-containing protein [Bacteroidota bacterium]